MQTLTDPGIHFELSEEQKAVRDAARDFAQNVLKPGVIERDREQKFPAAEIKQFGELGFLGMMVAPKYGGGGMDTVSYVLAMEEISKMDASCSVVMSVNNSLVCWGLEEFGNEEQKQKYLVPLAKGEVIGAFCLSEPEAGSDATSQRTTAIDMGDHYLLNGTKNWITNGGTASTYSGDGPDRCRQGPQRHQLPHRGKGHARLRGGCPRRTSSASAAAIRTP
jgi:alkylation response protein AidB-like acyl-CoA dehydrogenase